MKPISRQILLEQINMMRREKNKTCVSVIAPLHHLSFDQKADKLHLEKAIQEATDDLILNYSTDAMPLVKTIKAMHRELKFNTTDKGVGCYVSENINYYTFFPFLIKEKILVSQRFDLRDLLFKFQCSIPYYVLHLDEKNVRLFAGVLNDVEEIKDKDFPLRNEENYEYESSSQSTSYSGYAHVKGFEKDKSIVKKNRFQQFSKQVDELLNLYMKGDEIIILCGDRQHTAAFLNRTHHGDRIISVVNGNYERLSENEISTLAWPVLQTHLHEKMLDEISDLSEKIGEGLAVVGINNVWEAVDEGRGSILLIEKDFHVKSNAKKGVKKPSHYLQSFNEDAINDLLEMMLDKDGRIVFVENGMLQNQQNIALITRY